MTITALLPMKGTSERIPNKNLKEFNGRPLYHAIMFSLLNSKYIEKIVINTDSDRIKDDIKRNFNEDKVNIIDRPLEIQGGDVPMNEIIKYDITYLNDNHFIQTHSTNPLLRSKTIDKAIEFYFKNIENFDSIFSVTKLQTRLYDQNGKPLNHNPSKLLRTQDLPPVYEENSNFYIFSRDSFFKKNNRIGINPYLYEINKLEAIDIDEPEDFLLAELLYMNRDKIFKDID